ncbi:MAG: hypothetical protein A2W91_09665 [Bacteroidetes bacterium GWF2_38_335]|nr:MAG: hypothetical protein A2W91_09665 [Bacteroidetes bacterium GWF2_38_335]OFY78857.1 MAG: hypothetical protein A2281_14000 [Bacteroidetes bacterium RIFOXYA12_FULL_38_20]HBS86299.1 acetyl-CoA carboxylase biotin carboxyl carrier protein subunit [Bacteroidales bacterium]
MKKYSFSVNNEDYNVEILSIENGNAKVSVNGDVINIRINSEAGQAPVTVAAPAKEAPKAAEAAPAAKVEPEQPKKIEGKLKGSIKSPLPGIIRAINVKVGDVVKIGDSVLVLDAMKMDNNINADVAGKVLAICVNSGDSVMEGDVLLELGE